MEVKEALKILDQGCAECQGNRAAHVAMQQAIQMVTKLLEPKKDEKESDSSK